MNRTFKYVMVYITPAQPEQQPEVSRLFNDFQRTENEYKKTMTLFKEWFFAVIVQITYKNDEQ